MTLHCLPLGPSPGSRIHLLAFTAGLLIAASQTVLAIDDRADMEPNEGLKSDQTVAWKFTASVYHESAGRSAFDINLRGNRENDVFWIGQYERGSEFRQMRLGYEHQFALPFGKLIASTQYASHGFWGASGTLELGSGRHSPYFGLVGLGRTNTRPYYNLNFDPNDSTLFGLGMRRDSGSQVTLYQVKDDRLRTGQRVTHLVYRGANLEGSRWTLDLFRREGRSDPDAERFAATGVTLTYDWEPWFVRISRDPKVNYTASDMTRVSIGMRF
jgi:hypothetical protein